MKLIIKFNYGNDDKPEEVEGNNLTFNLSNETAFIFDDGNLLAVATNVKMVEIVSPLASIGQVITTMEQAEDRISEALRNIKPSTVATDGTDNQAPFANVGTQLFIKPEFLTSAALGERLRQQDNQIDELKKQIKRLTEFHPPKPEFYATDEKINNVAKSLSGDHATPSDPKLTEKAKHEPIFPETETDYSGEKPAYDGHD